MLEQAYLAEAEIRLEQAIAIRIEVLGKHHPHTARSLTNWARLLHVKGELPEAHRYYEQAISIFETTSGKEHPDTQVARKNLAKLLKDEG